MTADALTTGPTVSPTPEIVFAGTDGGAPDRARRLRGGRRLPRCAARAEMTPDEIIDGAQRLGPARPRRRVLPDRAQVELRPEARAEPEAALPRRERGRVRAGHVQGPRDHAARPVPLPRGLPHRGARDRVEARLHLHPRRVRARVRDPRRRPRRRCARRSSSATSRSCIHRGAGAYICGEETALLESLEGKRGQPRPKPPFPAIAGLYAVADAVNNVESITTVPPIIEMGGAEYAKLGAESSTGTRVFSLSGNVVRPGELRAAARLPAPRPDLRASAAASPDGRALKAVIPGGSSTPDPHGGGGGAGHARLRLALAGRHGDRLGGGDRDRRPLLHGAARRPRVAVLRARVVRQVHAVPRRDALADADPEEDRGRARHPRRPRPPARRRRADHRQRASARSATRSRSPSRATSRSSARSSSRTSRRAAARSTASRRSTGSSRRPTSTRPTPGPPRSRAPLEVVA